MAGTSSSATPPAIGPKAAGLSRGIRVSGAPVSVRIPTRCLGIATCKQSELGLAAEAPSCIYVGPIETASKETLEALYCQARDAYYNGKPLIVDDMFDRVELKLRWYGSDSVVKYPRCSLRRQSVYSDAEEDLSQAFALAGIWILFLAFGGLAMIVPVLYTVGLAYQDALNSGIYQGTQASALGFLSAVNGVLLMAFGSVVGYPIFSASVGVLQGLWRKDLAALKGACPNCGEEVFAFVRSDQSGSSPHRSDCHVCDCTLEFCTKIEQPVSILGRRWVHGRVYLVSRRGRTRRQRWI
ncbi:PGR5-like protein 1A, chloroplastic isoform X1 [Rhodamnia argentea]|uniref:PGR5-like protein 1A, chloroplastic isoform X1 n=1 Tax=Rhodamnia argentea TaxID=178133 RepID=A0A8B8PSQ7_9MYRT|nr:PGR5-like protein 1A, chloroplastic isoform X1 [Rhodamnia argentea]